MFSQAPQMLQVSNQPQRSETEEGSPNLLKQRILEIGAVTQKAPLHVFCILILGRKDNKQTLFASNES